MKNSIAIFGLRIIHGVFTLYFLLCLIYVYYAAYVSNLNTTALVAVLSLCLEGIAVFLLNKGDCPLIHIQKRVGDTTPFFALILPAKLAKQAIPIFAVFTLIGLAALIMRTVS